MKLIFNLTPDAIKARPFFYDNSHICGECTGAGCKLCYDRTGLRRLGSETFPLALAINCAKPPAIVETYAEKFTQFYLPKYYGVKPLSLRAL
jgi:hypothetical protein